MSKPRYHSVPAFAIAGLLLTALPGALRAQPQADSTPSVAEAARRARKQKKKAKPVRTITNDDLPAAPSSGANAADAQAAPAKAEDHAAATGDIAPAPAVPASGEQAKQKQADNSAALERAKKELARAQHELDVSERKAALDSDAYYSKADFANDKEGKANLDAQAQQIAEKQQAVAALKARVEELQALAPEPAPAEPDKNPPNR